MLFNHKQRRNTSNGTCVKVQSHLLKDLRHICSSCALQPAYSPSISSSSIASTWYVWWPSPHTTSLTIVVPSLLNNSDFPEISSSSSSRCRSDCRNSWWICASRTRVNNSIDCHVAEVLHNWIPPTWVNNTIESNTFATASSMVRHMQQAVFSSTTA